MVGIGEGLRGEEGLEFWLRVCCTGVFLRIRKESFFVRLGFLFMDFRKKAVYDVFEEGGYGDRWKECFWG